MWKAQVLTLFPDMFPGPLAHALAGRGLQEGIWDLVATNIRDFATDKRRTVDDTCYGHGAGMILKPDVIDAALSGTVAQFDGRPRIIYTTPRGVPFRQTMAHEWAASDGVIILCGRYEGVDDRVISYWRETAQLEEVSVGDYILAGGEMAAMVLLDACVRLLPNIVHSEESLVCESFELDLLEFPQYTKPCEWRGRAVPEVLLSGDHRRIAQWQQEESERVTRERRPDLWLAYQKKRESAARNRE